MAPAEEMSSETGKKNCLLFSVHMANASIKSWYTVVLMHHHFDGFCDFEQMLGIWTKKKKMNQLLCALLSDTIQRGMRTNALISIEFASVVCCFFFFSLDALDLFLSALYSSVFTFHCNQAINTRICTQKIC